mgnify:CR=1 FL=1
MIKEKENGEAEIKESKTNIVKTGGKLYIAGEYSVLTLNQSAIIKNIDIFMKAEIKFSEKYSIYSDMYDYSVTLEEDDKNYSLITETVNIVNEYLQLKGIHIKPFNMKITGKMEKNGKKYGIGSSGSVVILVIKAMFELYYKKLNKKFFSKEIIFKLAAYTLLKLGDNGSMGDLACISYENMVFYTSFDREKIKEFIEKKDLKEVLEMDWGYKIEEIKCGIECNFLVGWTKKPSISSEMIKIVKSSIDKKFLSEVQVIVNNLREAIINGDSVRKIRTDDLGRVNDTLYDTVKIDKNENIIVGSETQIKFLGNSKNDPEGLENAKRAFQKLSSEKFKKYLDNNAEISVPPEQYQGILNEADSKINKLSSQLDKLKNLGKTEEVLKIENKINDLKKLKKNLITKMF